LSLDFYVRIFFPRHGLIINTWHLLRLNLSNLSLKDSQHTTRASSKVSCVFEAKIRLSANPTSSMKSLMVSSLANTSFIYKLKRCGNNGEP
jgi:hypothetical protein